MYTQNLEIKKKYKIHITVIKLTFAVKKSDWKKIPINNYFSTLSYKIGNVNEKS